MWNNDTVSVTGEVTALGKGFVEIKTDGHCAGCSACMGADKARRPLRINTDIELKLGDRVIIRTPSANFLKNAGFFYGLPLAAMIIAALTARYMADASESVTAVISLAAVAICWLAVGVGFSKRKTMSDQIEKL